MAPPISFLRLLLLLLVARTEAALAKPIDAESAAASSVQEDFSAAGPVDHDRFASAPPNAWKGNSQADRWSWQVAFAKVERIGAILQVQGDHDFVLRNAPRTYVWQSSLDGQTWRDLPETKTAGERRLFRIHRLAQSVNVRFLRIAITSATGNCPTLREVEFYSDPHEKISFPDWIVAVNTTHDDRLPNHGQEFIPLARSCAGQKNQQAQQVWLGSFNEDLIKAEPRPLCAFLSGNFKDWCEIDREPWRGTQQILRRGQLPMWASCGGAQGLAILAEVGVDRPWDCPHCRDPRNPKSPIYTHIGHTGQRPCGDYSACVFERGPHRVLNLGNDPVFRALPREFEVMESHCGQIEWPPAGWNLIATAGMGTLTKTQCLRVKGRPIYAAQFHIEMAGTPDTSRRIMSNFLDSARKWNRQRSR